MCRVTSRPHHSPTRITAATEARILQLRDGELGPARIASAFPPSVPTVYRPLVRHGRNQLHPPVVRPVQRYEKTRPGELVHVDLKYLPSLENRAQFDVAAVDDFTREARVWIADA